MNSIAKYFEMDNGVKEFSCDNHSISGKSKITDKGSEIFLESIVGNVTLEYLSIRSQAGITSASVPFLKDVVTKSGLKTLSINNSSINLEEQKEILALIETPISEREIPIFSSSKSASKVNSQSS